MQTVKKILQADEYDAVAIFSLSRINIGSKGAEALGLALQTNSRLTSIK